MSFFLIKPEKATNSAPVFYGFHLSKKGRPQFTLQFSDDTYTMTPSWTTLKKLPLDSEGFLKLRCSSVKTCKAKAAIKYKLCLSHIENWERFKRFLNDPDSWEIKTYRKKFNFKIQDFYSERWFSLITYQVPEITVHAGYNVRLCF